MNTNYKDENGNEYATESLLRLNQFYSALKKEKYADRLSLVEVIINGNGIELFRETIHNEKPKKKTLNIKGQFIKIKT